MPAPAPAPTLTAYQRRCLAAMRADAERQAAVGGHIIAWRWIMSDSTDDGTPLHPTQDGLCTAEGRVHLRAVITDINAQVIWQFGKPTDRCAG